MLSSRNTGPTPTAIACSWNKSTPRNSVMAGPSLAACPATHICQFHQRWFKAGPDLENLHSRGQALGSWLATSSAGTAIALPHQRIVLQKTSEAVSNFQIGEPAFPAG